MDLLETTAKAVDAVCGVGICCFPEMVGNNREID
jgi:hypothetical protein